MKKGTLDTAAVTSPPGKGVHASDPRPQEDSEVEACTGSLKFQVSLINLVNSYLKLKKKKKRLGCASAVVQCVATMHKPPGFNSQYYPRL